MVFPVLIPIAAGYLIKNEYGEGKEIPKELGDDLLEGAEAILGDFTDFVSNIDWEAIGMAVGNVAAEVVKAAGEGGLGFVRGIGPALVEGAQGAYDAIADTLDDREADVIAGLTVAILVIVTSIYLYHEITRGPN